MSSSRKVVTRASGSRIASPPPRPYEDLFGDLTPLAPISIPHSSSHSFASLEEDFECLGETDPSVILVDDESFPDKDLEPLVRGISHKDRELFRSKPFFNCNSVLNPRSSDMEKFLSGKFCAFDMGFSYHFPQPGDCMWDPPQPGWQAIPLLFFELGFHLPMHPLFSAVLQVLGCGIAQLAPNAVAQITGVGARAHEMKVEPSTDLLFSVFRVKNSGGQLYLDKKGKQARLVDVRTSNSSYHTKWLYFEGPGLELVKPWNDVSKAWLRAVNNLPSFPDASLKRFHGSEEKFTTEDFARGGFLAKRRSKNFAFFLALFICALLF